MPDDPSFTILFGDLKAGKTADAAAAFPQALFIAAPGALQCTRKLWDFDPPTRNDLETFDDVTDFARKSPARDLVLDDATLLADRTAGAIARRKVTGYDLWALVLESAVRMGDALRRRGSHVVMTCHPRAAHVEHGVRIRGGPSFAGQCAMKIPARADFLLHAEPRGGATGAGGALGQGSSGQTSFGWTWIYRTGYSPDWMRGTRHDTPDLVPVNLSEILRLAGYRIARLPGLEWQEDLANALANRLLETGLGDPKLVLDALARTKEYALRHFTKSEGHAYWALRDGYDRAVLHLAEAGQRKSLWGV